MDLEVVVAGELLVAQKALCHRSVGVVCELVSAQHLLQAEGEVAHLGNTRVVTTEPHHLGGREGGDRHTVVVDPGPFILGAADQWLHYATSCHINHWQSHPDAEPRGRF